MDPAEKTRENRLRRMAHRQGLELQRNPRRDPQATDYGSYILSRNGEVIADFGWRKPERPRAFVSRLDEIESYLDRNQRCPQCGGPIIRDPAGLALPICGDSCGYVERPTALTFSDRPADPADYLPPPGSGTPYPEKGIIGPALDRYFPPLGPCLICGVPGQDQRHRVLDAIYDAAMSGEDMEMIATAFHVPEIAVLLAIAWVMMERRDPSQW